METFVNGTTALLQTLQEELGSLQRNTLEENLVPIFLSASTSAIVLGESWITFGNWLSRKENIVGRSYFITYCLPLEDRGQGSLIWEKIRTNSTCYKVVPKLYYGNFLYLFFSGYLFKDALAGNLLKLRGGSPSNLSIRRQHLNPIVATQRPEWSHKSGGQFQVGVNHSISISVK